LVLEHPTMKLMAVIAQLEAMLLMVAEEVLVILNIVLELEVQEAAGRGLLHQQAQDLIKVDTHLF
jgi:hypothetical protein